MDRWRKQRPLIETSHPASDIASEHRNNKDSYTKGACRFRLQCLESKLKKIRRYDENYLCFGFSWCGDEKEPKPQCFICTEKLSNHSTKPSLLQRHFNTEHALSKDKPLEFFK